MTHDRDAISATFAYNVKTKSVFRVLIAHCFLVGKNTVDGKQYLYEFFAFLQPRS